MNCKNETELREILYDREKIEYYINKNPHTYKTFLKYYYNTSGTCVLLLKKKLQQMCKSGEISQCVIPGTRRGMKLFYTTNKKYDIIIESGRISNKVYCVYKYKRVSNYHIKATEVLLLNGIHWECAGTKIFFEGNILKWI